MGLKGLGDYLGRFKNLKTPKEFKKTLIQKTIKEEVGIYIDTKNIEINGKNVFLKVFPLYKSEISIKKEEIKEALKKSGVFIETLT